MTKKPIIEAYFLVENVDNSCKLWTNQMKSTIKCPLMTKNLFAWVVFLVISGHFMVDVDILWSMLDILWF